MYLESMITSNTHVITLDYSMALEEKKIKEILGCKQSNKYRMFYQYEDVEYIFKSEEDCFFREYPYALWNEVIGSALANHFKTATATYQIAKLRNRFGLASPNFKTSQYDYYYMDFLPISDITPYISSLENIKLLEQACISEKNQEQLLRDIFCLFVIDFYMIQSDRVSKNIQFQIDKKTGSLRLTPLYDYSLCRGSFPDKKDFNFGLKNPILYINKKTIQLLLKKYELFAFLWNDMINLDFDLFWNQIQSQYHLNEDSPVYQEMKSFYQTKDCKQKKVMKDIYK